MAKRNWDFIQKQQPGDTMKYRDVYEDQQLERGTLQAKQTKTSRIIIAIILTAMIAVLSYLIACVGEPIMNGLLNTATQTASSATGDTTTSGDGSTETVLADSGPVAYEVVKGDKYGVYEVRSLDGVPNGDVWTVAADGLHNIYSCPNYPGVTVPEEAGDPLETIRRLYDMHTGKVHQSIIDSTSGTSSNGTAVGNFTIVKVKYGVYDVVDKDGNTIDTWTVKTEGAYNWYYCSNHADFRIQETEGDPAATIAKYYDLETGEFTPESSSETTESSDGETTTEESSGSSDGGLFSSMGISLKPTVGKLFFTFIVSAIAYLLIYTALMRNLEAQNMLSDTADINQNHNDQHIALPEEVMRKFDWFPDVGATSDVQFSSMISHVALKNKGLKKVHLSRRAETDILDEDGDIEYYKGEVLLDDDGEPLYDEVPIIDIDFMEDLFQASGTPKLKEIRKYYDATKIPYNPDGSDREKLGKFNTVADLINEDWEFPYYEPQRPAGAYLVDTAPVNTMVLAITRAGKGQTVIEPTLDMWTRERRPNNMVVNDPKGELLVKNYVRATVRGFQVVQFNLINAMKTDIYNPLGMAADAAREGDFTKCAMYVENIADVFFPLDGGDDPVWPNAANNAFKRAAYGLIDFYLEEEKELRLFAERTNMDDKILETKLDEMWGKVTLYNTYQLFVQLTAKKLKNPSVEFANKVKNHEFDNLTQEEYDVELMKVENQSKLWEDKPETDLLTLYFNATDALPRNQMRTLVANANNALKAMAGAEKMMASVYGIAITAMSFFTDPTISTLTSGTPSQNVDLAGMSFPRRLGVRFNSDFIHNYHLIGMQAKWMSYSDANFENELGKEFYHEDLITREGWARYYFKGIYPKDIAYIKLEIVNPNTGMLIRRFYFQFKKSYQTSLDGRKFVTDPVLGSKIVKNGILTELRPVKGKDGNVTYRKAKTTFDQDKIVDIMGAAERGIVKTNAIIRTLARYSEKPKMVFLVTPPHLMKYAKLILILIKQLVDLNFDQSYMTKSNQKPLYKTRFMLDELGNLQSEGHGISGFETMLSIGLGQEQQFTLILQTLQQLRDVYGDSVDKIVQGNTSNIVFLKSTDDSMLDTLQKMSGTTHKSFTDSKSVTRDMETIFKGMSANEGKATYTMTTKEVPVISYNDMAFISERNSIIFRAGDSPIWNRNETILPMSWRLFSNTITQPGKEYTLQTIPTLSSAIDFDVRKNQPDFKKMLDKRMNQAYMSQSAKDLYQTAYEYSDYDIEQLDDDNYSDEIMDIINTYVRDANTDDEDYEVFEYDFDGEDDLWGSSEENQEQLQETASKMQEYNAGEEMKFAGGLISPNMLVSHSGHISHQLDKEIIKAYLEVKGDMWNDTGYFTVKNGSLYGIHNEPYIIKQDTSKDLKMLNDAAKDENSSVFADADVSKDELTSFGSFMVTDEFYRFLASQSSWRFANGKFETQMKRQMES